MFKHSKGRVEMILTVPGHRDRAFPINSVIPFTVVVSTFSVPVYATADPETDKDALCPSIDIAALHLLLRLRLKCYTNLRTHGIISMTEQSMTSHRDLSNFRQKHALDVDIGPKEWVECGDNEPKLRGKGRWKQELVFRSNLTLSPQLATPTFKHTLVDVRVRTTPSSCRLLFCDCMSIIRTVCAQARLHHTKPEKLCYGTLHHNQAPDCDLV